MAGGEENIDPSINVENKTEDILDNDLKTQGTEEYTEAATADAPERLVKLPVSRVKSIMKSDPDVSLASSEAVVALAKATELFIYHFAKDAVNSTLQSKRKTLQRKDLDIILDSRDAYIFLEGALD